MTGLTQSIFEEKDFINSTTTLKKFFEMIRNLSSTHYTDIEILSDEFVRGGILKNIRIIEPPIKFSFQEIIELIKFLCYSVKDNGNLKHQSIEPPLSFSFSIKGYGHFRTQVLRERRGIIMTLRRLSYVIPDYDLIGVPEYLKEAFLRGIGAMETKDKEVIVSGGQRGGLILVTGPMGSGKTTTIASMLKYVADNVPMVILTIEDPIEYVHTNSQGIFKQLEVPTHIPSHEEALYHALRSNAGVIFLGEVRSTDELKKLLTASEYGTLTVTTFHVPDSVGAIERIAYELNSDISRKLLASALIGVLNQRLIYTTDSETNKPSFHLVCEWLPVNLRMSGASVSAVQEFIIEQKFAEIRKGLEKGIWREFGAISLEDSIRELCAKGVCSVDELLRSNKFMWASGVNAVR